MKKTLTCFHLEVLSREETININGGSLLSYLVGWAARLCEYVGNKETELRRSGVPPVVGKI